MRDVLIIDDEVDICLLLSTMLRLNGIEADVVHSLADAQWAILNKKYHLIFLDNHFGDDLGIDYINTIKEISPASSIIMLSAYSLINKNEILEKGVHSFIDKPFSHSTITNAINSVN